MNWRVVFSIAQKDLVDAIKNMYLLFVMVMPIGMSLMFQVIIPSEQEMGQVKIAVYDPGSSRLLSNLQAHTDIEIITAQSEQDVLDVLEADKDIAGGVVIPGGFDAALDAAQNGNGEKPRVRAIVNGNASNIQQSVFRAALTDQTWLLVRQDFPVDMVWEDPTMSQAAASAQGANEGGPNSPFDIERYLLLVTLMMGLAMVGAFVVPSLMVEEKEKHTLEALLVAPGGPAEVAAGKAIVGMVYSLLVGGTLLALNKGLGGNLPLTLASLFLGALLIVGVGLLMGTAFKVMHQVNVVSSVVMLLLLIPSWVGIFSLPAPLDSVVYVIPTHYLGELLQESLAGAATLAGSWVNLAVVTGSAAAVFALEIWLLRRERKG